MKKFLFLALIVALFVSCSKDSDEDSDRLLVNSASEIQGSWSRLQNSDLITYEFSGNTWKSKRIYSKDYSSYSSYGTFSISKGKITFSYGHKNLWGDKIEDKVESIEWADDAKSTLLIDKLPYRRD